MNEPDRFALKWFCPCCFADEISGSMDHLVIPTTTGCHCTNCGSSGGVQLPGWAIERIRQSASWVGRRFYPGPEDKENYEERQDLLELVSEYPGRSAEWRDDGWWSVTQKLPTGSVMTFVKALDAEDAMRKCSLRYVPRHKL